MHDRPNHARGSLRAAGRQALLLAARCVALLAALHLVVGCASGGSAGRTSEPAESAASAELRRLLEVHEREFQSEAGVSASAIKKRAAVARRLYDQGAIESPTEKLFAAALLYETYDLDDLALSETLALDAAKGGDPRGFPLAAEAIDRQLLRRNLPQRYGTQYLYDPVSARWTLYRVDPNTTDEERQLMGVAPLEEALRREGVLNDSAKRRAR